MPENTYEFSAEENQTLRVLSKRMRAVAMFLFVMGGLAAFQGLQILVDGGNYFLSIALAVVYIMMGTWTMKASKSFMNVVRTEGNDIIHLMQALASLLSLYSMQFWVFILFIVLMVIILLFVGVGASEISSPMS